MTRTLLPLALLAVPGIAAAQQGTVTYTESIKIEIELPPEMASMRDQIPNARTSTKQLLFNESASLMRNAPREEDESGDVHVAGEGFAFRMMGPREDNQRYTDLDEDRVIEKRDFLGRTFLITGDREALPWRLTDEQSTYLGYPCMKAVAVRDTTTIEAWFTSEIPVPAGPAEYGGLPGLILVMSIDGGRMTYTATGVDLESLADGSLAPPTEGKEVTREEFDKVVEEKMKEMGINRSGRAGPAMRVMIHNN